MNYACVCFVSHKKLKPAGKIIRPSKMDSWAKQVSSLLINSSSLGYVLLLHGLILYIFRQRLPHWNSAEGLFRYWLSVFHGVSLV